ncbi:BUD13 homolog [Toxorhynchites rutilus septentrionalis]|uniref:BUD13 homolog n=1 Tax=Toxorhynchites rutilus septentrionalis TaxID=329112 RepID=UPI00247955F8|nr:BUD13 homolog [Toxorhynchites rutilus septentrionalis]
MGNLKRKVQIHATEDVYQKTTHRMTTNITERRSKYVEEIKPNDRDIGRKVVKKLPEQKSSLKSVDSSGVATRVHSFTAPGSYVPRKKPTNERVFSLPVLSNTNTVLAKEKVEGLSSERYDDNFTVPNARKPRVAHQNTKNSPPTMVSLDPPKDNRPASSTTTDAIGQHSSKCIIPKAKNCRVSHCNKENNEPKVKSRSKKAGHNSSATRTDAAMNDHKVENAKNTTKQNSSDQPTAPNARKRRISHCNQRSSNKSDDSDTSPPTATNAVEQPAKRPRISHCDKKTYQQSVVSSSNKSEGSRSNSKSRAPSKQLEDKCSKLSESETKQNEQIKSKRQNSDAQFTMITSLEQRRKYRAFHDDLSKEYQKLADVIHGIKKRCVMLERSLIRKRDDEAMCKAIENDIYKEWQQFEPARDKFEHLRNNLITVTKLINEYDRSIMCMK